MSSEDIRTVVVTGGSKGIGRAVCVAFADRDTRVFFNYRTSDASARETERLVKASGGKATGVSADSSNEQEITGFFKKVIDETGRLDVLVNNAGITRDKLLVRMKNDEWNDVINSNLGGTFLCTRLAAKKMMRQRNGRIINITSVAGVAGNAGQSNYSASKAGIIGLTKSVARELASCNVTVNAVAPGFIETGMTEDIPDKNREKIMDYIPAGRAGLPEDVAHLVRFLASGNASYITGQVIHVNGGMYI